MSGLVSGLSELEINGALRKPTTHHEIVVPTAADDTNSNNLGSGRRNQAITKPITVNDTTGEVLVRKTTGKTKLRKGQSIEDYQEQLRQYFVEEKGPTRTNEKWMDAIEIDDILSKDMDFSLKQTRQRFVSYAQRYYYLREYTKCLQVSDWLLERFMPLNKKNKMVREIDELKYMISKSKERIVHT